MRRAREGVMAGLEQIINPALLYGAVALGGVGVAIALPRKGLGPQAIGALLAGIAAGAVILGMTLKAGGDRPSAFFYIFGLVALGGALRVITHTRPVYAALWFIMVVLATAGLLLLLSAEFMTFALVIIYAGAILITYLFVIMLATQAPEEGEVEVLAEYDTTAREPIAATVVGFILLAVLSTMAFRGVGTLPAAKVGQHDELLGYMPRKVENVLRNEGLLADGATAHMNAAAGVVRIQAGDQWSEIPRDKWPEQLRVTNVEALGFNLLRDHPGTIEIAGVILLMAMLGAVVLSRKQVQIDEEAKLRQARDRHTLMGGTP